MHLIDNRCYRQKNYYIPTLHIHARSSKVHIISAIFFNIYQQLLHSTFANVIIGIGKFLRQSGGPTQWIPSIESFTLSPTATESFSGLIPVYILNPVRWVLQYNNIANPFLFGLSTTGVKVRPRSVYTDLKRFRYLFYFIFIFLVGIQLSPVRSTDSKRISQTNRVCLFLLKSVKPNCM